MKYLSINNGDSYELMILHIPTVMDTSGTYSSYPVEVEMLNKTETLTLSLSETARSKLITCVEEYPNRIIRVSKPKVGDKWVFTFEATDKVCSTSETPIATKTVETPKLDPIKDEIEPVTTFTEFVDTISLDMIDDVIQLLLLKKFGIQAGLGSGSTKKITNNDDLPF